MSAASGIRVAHVAAAAATLLGCAMSHATETPCHEVARDITTSEKSAFAKAIAPQLGATRVDVLDSLRYGGWRVLYVDSHVADEAFLFFSADPASSHYVTLWSGAAAKDEEAGIRRWVTAHAPGIPPVLAACFAWHVTADQR